MSDKFAAERLPDLPNAGYATERQRATSDLVMFWLRAIERDRLMLLSIVVDGKEKWRKVAGSAWHLNRASRSTAVTTDLLDQVWAYMVLLAGPNPAEQLLILMAQLQERERAQWDHRTRTKTERRKLLTNALVDLEKYGHRSEG